MGAGTTATSDGVDQDTVADPHRAGRRRTRSLSPLLHGSTQRCSRKNFFSRCHGNRSKKHMPMAHLPLELKKISLRHWPEIINTQLYSSMKGFDNAGVGDYLERYSDPSYFKKSSDVMRADKMHMSKKKGDLIKSRGDHYCQEIKKLRVAWTL